MAQTFWTGSNLSFTNGSKIVTVNTGPSVDSIFQNSKLKSGNYNEPVEVKSAYGSTIELYENWPGSTANTSATVTPSSAAAAAAGVAAQQVVTEIQNLVGSASATATANSFVKRDSNGRIKAATPSANDDVVTKGYIGSAATKNVGILSGNIPEFKIGGALGVGVTSPTAKLDVEGNQNVIGRVTQQSTSITSGNYTFEIDSSSHSSNLSTAGAFAVDVNSGRAFTIDGKGNVGIGTDSQDNTLEVVSGAANSVAGFRSTDSQAYISFADDTTTGFNFVGVGAEGNDMIMLAGAGEKMRIADNGNIGIGTKNQTERLHVFDSVEPQILVSDNGGKTLYTGIQSDGSVGFRSDSALPLTYTANNSERLRVDGSGMLVNGNTAYHSGNTNFNEFGANSTGDAVLPCFGLAVSPNIVTFAVPLNSTVAPSGVSNTGTFNLYNLTTSQSEDAGITASLDSISSPKTAYIRISGLAGKNIGDVYLLRADTASSKITVNF